MSGFPGYDEHDALGLAALVRGKAVTPEELLDEALSRVAAWNPKLNAVVRLMEGPARGAIARGLPDGPFHGVPFLLKDLMSAVEGVPLSNGSRFMAGFVPETDGELVRRYRAAGLVLAGKTNTPELGLVPYTEPDLFGPARNPWDLTRTPGGSSGGSAAAVAAGIVPMAHGGDGGGSIRIPASCCGVFGLKPTRGRTPMGPEIGDAWNGFVVEHALTRSVRDSAALLDATSGPDPGAPWYPPAPERPFLEEVAREPGRLRVAVTGRPFLGSRVHPDCLRVLGETARLLAEMGHAVEEAAPEIDAETFALDFVTMLCGEVRAELDEAAERLGRAPALFELEPATHALRLLGGSIRAGAYDGAVRRLRLAGRRVGAFFERWDLLMTPTLASPAVPVGALQLRPAEKMAAKTMAALRAGWLLRAVGILEATAKKTFDFMPFTPPFNVSGQPAMSVPLGTSAGGLPVGVHFVGRFADEATLFRLAGQLERARPWASRRPPRPA
ncbi:MAG TPA: amidase [Thermoanaerobaculia bacterium]|nr:amidase [Thermoanaerobaculia bacterium]